MTAARDARDVRSHGDPAPIVRIFGWGMMAILVAFFINTDAARILRINITAHITNRDRLRGHIHGTQQWVEGGLLFLN